MVTGGAICSTAGAIAPPVNMLDEALGRRADFFLRQSSSRNDRRRSRISARGGRQGIDDLIWDGDERFLTYLR